MVSVEVTWDADEVADGQPGDGPDQGSVWLDVDVADEVIWFDAAELDPFPVDQPDAEPSQAELDEVEKIKEAFGQSIVDDVHAREAAGLTDAFYRRIARHRGLTRALTEVGSLGRQR